MRQIFLVRDISIYKSEYLQACLCFKKRTEIVSSMIYDMIMIIGVVKRYNYLVLVTDWFGIVITPHHPKP